MGIPTLPNEVNGSIQHLLRRGVKQTRSSRLKRLLKVQKRQEKMLSLVLPKPQRKSPWN
jgi:hypothetical protein